MHSVSTVGDDYRSCQLRPSCIEVNRPTWLVVDSRSRDSSGDALTILLSPLSELEHLLRLRL